MIGTRYEGYAHLESSLPFVLNGDIERTSKKYSKEKNWHEELEIQLCEKGRGRILLNGEERELAEGDIAVVNSGVIHYTGSEERIVYSCIIINNGFLEQFGIRPAELHFDEIVRSEALLALIGRLKKEYAECNTPMRNAKLSKILLEIIIELVENHAHMSGVPRAEGRAFENVKGAMKYIRANYGEKITLDAIAHELCTDKYTLCREFKKYTGQTVIEYTNNYRCQKAAELISEGCTVGEAAGSCGFENLSFFTRCFKKSMKMLPSSCKKH